MKKILLTFYFINYFILNSLSQSSNLIINEIGWRVDMKYLKKDTTFVDTLKNEICFISYLNNDEHLSIIKYSSQNKVLEAGQYCFSKIKKGNKGIENPNTGKILIRKIKYREGLKNGYWLSFNEEEKLIKIEEWNKGFFIKTLN